MAELERLFLRDNKIKTLEGFPCTIRKLQVLNIRANKIMSFDGMAQFGQISAFQVFVITGTYRIFV
jgi:hypothetical protein